MLHPEHVPLQRIFAKGGLNHLGRDLSGATVRRAAHRPALRIDLGLDILGQTVEAVLMFLVTCERDADLGRR